LRGAGGDWGGGISVLGCRSLQAILISPTVKAINDFEFESCSATTVNGGDGREGIGERKFLGCRLLQKILVSPAFNTIKNYAFNSCSHLTTLIGGEGLKEIGVEEF
jgi:hypothetical protein